jgi:Putative binding domain, N-terminal/Viral BACON domain
MDARPFSWSLAAAVVSAALVLWSCGSTSVSVTAPTGSKCQVNAVATAESAPATGTTGTLTVTANRDCTWTASTQASWIALTSNASGQGDGTVSYRVAENTDPVSRRGMLAVNDAQIPIAQDAAPCRYVVTPASSSVAVGGGSTSVHVDTHSGCAWSAASQSDWIQVTAGGTGSGAGNVSVSVAANSGTGSRTGSVTVAGQSVTFVQAGSDGQPPPTPSPAPGPTPSPTCAYSISTTTADVGAGASIGSFGLVASASTCAWTVTSNAAWITITSASIGTGNTTVAWAVAPNTGPARSGTITIAGQTFTISQAAPCAYIINPSSQSFPAVGGPGTIAVGTTGGCTWTATTTDQWITLGNNVSGTGAGSVSFTIASNSGAARTGTVVVAGQTFTVTQAAAPPACAYVVVLSKTTFTGDGGSGTINVTTGSTCQWTATSNDGWISIAQPGSGTGTGTVAFTVAKFNGNSRTGAILVAGQSFSVTQQK